MSSETKERPIPLNREEVRAILEGRKTQVRRVIKPTRRYPIDFVGAGGRNGEDWNDPNCWGFATFDGDCWWSLKAERGERQIPCPYGKPGDRLWVRETWSPMPGHRPIPTPEKYDDKPAWYRADNDRPTWAGNRWKPSTEMPRSASRIDLGVLTVRVERLQAISEEDAIAEGSQCAGVPASLTNVGAFAKLWDSINAARGFGWNMNPWVWVVSFKPLAASACTTKGKQ
jgi:hypothetical protein